LDKWGGEENSVIYPVQDESDILTLQDAIQLAIENNPRVKVGQEKVKEMQGIIKVVRSPYLPDIKFSAQFLRFRDPGLLNSSSFDDFQDDAMFDLTPEAQNTYNLTLSLDQPIYTWGKKKSALLGARLAVEQAGYDLNTQKQDLSLEVALMYYSLILAGNNLKVLEATRTFQEQHVKVTKDRYEAGLSKELDLLLAESALAGLIPRIVSARNTIRINKVQLNQLLGREGSTPVKVAENFPTADNFYITPENAIEFAASNRSELDSLNSLAGIYRAAVKISRAGKYPSVRFSGSYGQSTAAVSNLVKGNYRAWSIMLNFELPIYDGMKSKGEVEQYSANLNQTLNTIELQKDIIALEARQTLFALEEARNMLEASLIAYRAAEKALDSAKNALSAGTASNLEVLDAQKALATSKFNILQAKYQLASAETTLKKVLGHKITETFPESLDAKAE